MLTQSTRILIVFVELKLSRSPWLQLLPWKWHHITMSALIKTLRPSLLSELLLWKLTVINNSTNSAVVQNTREWNRYFASSTHFHVFLMYIYIITLYIMSTIVYFLFFLIIWAGWSVHFSLGNLRTGPIYTLRCFKLDSLRFSVDPVGCSVDVLSSFSEYLVVELSSSRHVLSIPNEWRLRACIQERFQGV